MWFDRLLDDELVTSSRHFGSCFTIHHCLDSNFSESISCLQVWVTLLLIFFNPRHNSQLKKVKSQLKKKNLDWNTKNLDSNLDWRDASVNWWFAHEEMKLVTEHWLGPKWHSSNLWAIIMITVHGLKLWALTMGTNITKIYILLYFCTLFVVVIYEHGKWHLFVLKHICCTFTGLIRGHNLKA